jgi:hypothetical protein
MASNVHVRQSGERRELPPRSDTPPDNDRLTEIGKRHECRCARCLTPRLVWSIMFGARW